MPGATYVNTGAHSDEGEWYDEDAATVRGFREQFTPSNTGSSQLFNTLDFFFEISDINEHTTYWIPEINDEFKKSFYNIEQLFFNELTFNEKSFCNPIIS